MSGRAAWPRAARAARACARSARSRARRTASAARRRSRRLHANAYARTRTLTRTHTHAHARTHRRRVGVGGATRGRVTSLLRSAGAGVWPANGANTCASRDGRGRVVYLAHAVPSGWAWLPWRGWRDEAAACDNYQTRACLILEGFADRCSPSDWQPRHRAAHMRISAHHLQQGMLGLASTLFTEESIRGACTPASSG
eukprot:6182722-Pleurochrysis_carterae.AAC.1